MTFETWLMTERARVVLLELDYFDVASNSTKSCYFSNHAFVTSPQDTPANTSYDPYIIGGIDFERSLSEVFSGQSVSKVASVSLLQNSDTIELLTRALFGRAIRVFLGDASWPKSQFVQIIAAICDGVQPEQTSIKLKLRDAADTFLKPLLSERVASGPSKGALKPLALGRCFNVKPLLLDDATHTYLFNCTPSAAVTAVRFNGASVPSANYTVDLAASTVTFSVYPQGEITLDVDGVKTSTFLNTATQFVQYIATRLGVAVDVAGLPSYMLGLYLTSDQSTFAVLDDICASVGAFWYVDRLGLFTVRAFNGTSISSARLPKDQTLKGSRNVRRTIAPLAAITAQYKRNWSPLSTIAGAIHEQQPALAKELAENGKSLSIGQNISAMYPEAQSINIDTLLVNAVDVTTELQRRLTLSSVPRFIYELKALAAPFSWSIGMTVTLEQPGINGDRAVLTKLIESPVKGRCNVEFWQ